MVFVFKQDIQKMIDSYTLLYSGNLDITRGLAKADGSWLINLSATQWKSVPETTLIEELNNTITHELCHTLINKLCPVPKRNNDNEDRICKIMSNQLP